MCLPGLIVPKHVVTLDTAMWQMPAHSPVNNLYDQCSLFHSCHFWLQSYQRIRTEYTVFSTSNIYNSVLTVRRFFFCELLYYVPGLLASGDWWEAWQPSPTVGYWHQGTDERHGNPPQGNQELLVVRDKVGRPPGELGVSKSMECDIFRSVLWHCWLGDRKGIRPVKKRMLVC